MNLLLNCCHQRENDLTELSFNLTRFTPEAARGKLLSRLVPFPFNCHQVKGNVLKIPFE